MGCYSGEFTGLRVSFKASSCFYVYLLSLLTLDTFLMSSLVIKGKVAARTECAPNRLLTNLIHGININVVTKSWAPWG